MNTEAAVVAFENVGKEFVSGDTVISVLRSVSLAIFPGERVAIVGPSGSGKSTLLNLAALLDRPDSGNVIFNGESITDKTSEQSLAALRRTDVGFVFQHFHLLDSLTVLHNAALPGLLCGIPNAYERAEVLLTRVGLQHRLRHYPAQLSGGEMQRCAIARALIHRPRLIAADEPTGSLDGRSASAVLDLLQEVCAELPRTALLIATHSAEAAHHAQRIIELPALMQERS